MDQVAGSLSAQQPTSSSLRPETGNLVFRYLDHPASLAMLFATMTQRTLNVAIACGGTGGHLLPGLLVGRECLRRGHKVDLWLSGRSVEREALRADWQGSVYTVAGRGLSGSLPRRVLRGCALLCSGLQCAWRMRASRPDVLLAMGGYASVGPVLGARLLGVPIVLHEANVVPGRAVEWLSRWAAAVAVSFPGTEVSGARGEVVHTGLPIRCPVPLTAPAESAPDDPPSLLVMGGSQGASFLNDTVPAGVAGMPGNRRIRVLHIAGRDADLSSIEEAYAVAGVEADVEPYRHDMAAVYDRTDYAVCRAGAGTCFELVAYGVPGLLIPLPGAPRDHQAANAAAVCGDGVLRWRRQAETTADWLGKHLAQVLVKRVTAPVGAGDSAEAAVADLLEEHASPDWRD